jgi:hypothetical protein
VFCVRHCSQYLSALRKEAAKMTAFSAVDSPRDKYDFDLFMTSAIVHSLINNVDKDCAPSDFFDDETGEVAYDTPGVAFLEFCDMGEERTPQLYDHAKHLSMADPISQQDSYACHFHTREGIRIASLEQLADLARAAHKKAKQIQETCEVNASGISVCSPSVDLPDVPQLEIYAVQAGRVFMFAPKFVGEIFDLPHVHTPDGNPVALEVLSISPKVFDVKHFFADYEADAIVNKALTETSETHKMKRSSTGASGYNLNSRRTSENAFDTHSKMAMVVKK